MNYCRPGAIHPLYPNLSQLPVLHPESETRGGKRIR
jgi:hypothetical protein